MTRRTTGLLIALALGLVAAPLAAEAQRGRTVPLIDLLLPFGTPSGPNPRLVRFKRALRELGYLEGENIGVEYRWAEGKLDRLPALAAELVRLQVDVIVTWGEAATRTVHDATSTIRIVVAIIGDLVAAGRVASLARPGGNITGLTDMSPELSAKRLELFMKIVPEVSHIAVLWNGTSPVKAADFRETQAAARALGVQLQSLEVQGPNGFEPAFKVATREGAGALLVLQDALTAAHAKGIVDLAAKSQLPAMYGLKGFVDVGSLMAYGVDAPERFWRAATYVDKLLKGAKPADLPMSSRRNRARGEVEPDPGAGHRQQVLHEAGDPREDHQLPMGQ
jgi:putative ABC transport system substrate-binding protein